MYTSTGRSSERYCGYNGGFSITVIPRANKKHLPKGIKITENMIIVENGTIYEVAGGVQFYANGNSDPFYYSICDIISVKDSEGNLLWNKKPYW
ncbi:MAG: hypothetical protein UY07_C0030G0008 [Parcubacteria group bacterium GW2011_GWA1_47_8]|nr:MAG: hypothetical protein UY07_C0030G0008 [Parcubacteria group bacterium GW2011_GWA1_47_8]